MKPGASHSQFEICLPVGPLEAVITVIPITEILGESSKVMSHPAWLRKGTLREMHQRGVFIFVTLI